MEKSESDGIGSQVCIVCVVVWLVRLYGCPHSAYQVWHDCFYLFRAQPDNKFDYQVFSAHAAAFCGKVLISLKEYSAKAGDLNKILSFCG